MAFEHPGDGALDYFPCHYGGSKLLFRGPRKPLDGRFAVFFGGIETYGKFIERPFPDLLGDALECTTVNMGCVNAGIDAYVQDHALLGVAEQARAAVIQVLGAANLSNRFYSVHPRRNDRFIKPSALMQTIYRDVDFSEITFTRHLLQALEAECPRRFDLLADELKAAWVARMKTWLGRIRCHRVLLWLADHAPEETGGDSDPRFIDRQMIEQLRPHVDDIVEVVYRTPSQGWPSDGMAYSELEAPAAHHTPGAGVHAEAAAALAPVLKNMVR
ncbi:DUF6473 family protein [Tropicimonas marinistellae]|uniref:DUF6473 family protein n=1 Tax=Tropicimonas marinistellae TaxID=1739787 RepID=UPI00083632B5|nr:DUF6473 family protein [Tropicimonas marinistellae]